MKRVNRKFNLCCVFLALCGLISSSALPQPVSKAAKDEKQNRAADKQTKEISDNQPTLSAANQSLSNIPLHFEENRGQFDRRVRYLTHSQGMTTFLTANEIVHVIQNPKSKVQGPRSKFEDGPGLDEVNPQSQIPNPKSERAVALRMRLVGAQMNSSFVGVNEQPGRINYFKGNDPERWQTEIRTFSGVNYEGVYRGVDLSFYSNQEGEFEYDFIVKPQANLNQIQMEIKGAEDVRVDENGDLEIKTELGRLKQRKPFTYQSTENNIKQEIQSRYKVERATDNRRLTTDKFTIKFDVGNYDATKPLIIDPSANLSNLAYSTFIGAGANDSGGRLQVDSLGNAYVTGETNSYSFPTVSGGFDTSPNGDYDIFVTKLNAVGTALIYSTFIGGRSTDYNYGMTIDSSGNVYLTGFVGSFSTDYPTTPGAFDTTHNGGFDAFVTKLNSTGSALIYSTFIGGNGQDVGFDITVDSSGCAYLIGYADEFYPTTPGSFDPTNNGGWDVVVTKLNSTGSALIYSTFIGGLQNDTGFGIAVDSSGNTFLTGFTFSIEDYPITPGAFDTKHNGQSDAFVTKLNSTGSALIYSTFIGGGGDESGSDIKVDSSGNAYLTGYTSSANYPTTEGAFDTTHNGDQDAFVTKLNSTGSALIYSTFIGGSGDDRSYSSAIDSSGNVFLTGDSVDATTDYPTTPGAFDTTHNGNRDVFISKLGDPSIAKGTAFDFDGDLRTDLSTFRPSNGQWWLNFSSTRIARVYTFGTSSDKLAPADYDGDGKTDVAFWRPSTGEWFVLRSSNLTFFALPFGANGDIPAPGDFDADGRADFVVFRPSNGVWYLNQTTAGISFVPFGTSGDIPTIGDYDGDRKSDVAIFRPSDGSWWVQRSTAGLFAIVFGIGTDKPVPGDYTGDGKTDIAFWRPSNGTWFVLRSEDLSFYSVPFGVSSDIPVPGDYDGDGKADFAVFRSSGATWYIQRSTQGTLIQQFGMNGDIPIPSAFVP